MRAVQPKRLLCKGRIVLQPHHSDQVAVFSRSKATTVRFLGNRSLSSVLDML